MMKKTTEQKFFTAGELANLFNISKQTLLYYDKIKLLSPDFISENGYRHYSIEQYLDLEIIVNLRSLNISIADIKEYLKNRNKDSFLKQIYKKYTECNKIIKENERICQSLERIANIVKKNEHVPLNQITMSWCPARMLRITELTDTDTGKQRIAKFAKHSQLYYHSKTFSEKHAGWSIKQTDFFNLGKANTSFYFFSFIEMAHAHTKFPHVILPAGLYLEIYFSGTFFNNYPKLLNKISEFLKINKLNAASDIFILPIENHWLCKDTNQYINKLFLEIVNIETKK